MTGRASSADRASTDASEPKDLIRVLIVDDDPRVLQAIGSTIALETDMVTVAEAADAKTALAVAEDTKPSVALVDVLLPDDVTGLALVRSLEQRPGCEVVAMSVRSGLRAAARAAGAVAFVEKGSDIDALLQALRLAAVSAAPDRRR
jgi:DNA-binding NarL/FixJ family response regulator